jgi:hypothetical protein
MSKPVVAAYVSSDAAIFAVAAGGFIDGASAPGVITALNNTLVARAMYASSPLDAHLRLLISQRLPTIVTTGICFAASRHRRAN